MGNFSVEGILIIGSILVFLSIIASKVSNELGVPVLLIFLGISMLAGSDGIGGVQFDNAYAAQILGSITLSIILFSGGLETDREKIKPILIPGLILATIGVGITAILLGICSYYILNEFSMKESLLFGSLIASTDAAAVFGILRSKNLNIKKRLASLLEFESGSNDPMAYFLVIFFISLISGNKMSTKNGIVMFFQGITIGIFIGVYMGQAMKMLVEKINLNNDFFYPGFTLSMAMFTYAMTNYIGGNGFLAVYIAGIILGENKFIHKERLLWFYNSIAWVFQMIMFISLGLLIFPSKLTSLLPKGVIIFLVLSFIVRPISVFLSLGKSNFNKNEKIFLSFAGLRGATSIVFATYPVLAGIKHADKMFNIVFIIVVFSFMLQGTTIPLISRLLKIKEEEIKEEKIKKGKKIKEKN